MKKSRISVLMMIAALLLSMVITGCGGSKKKSGNNNSNSSTVNLVLGQATGLNENFTNADNWEAANGASINVTSGVMTVTPGATEGIAVKLKDSVWQTVSQKLGGANQFYVEMLIKPTGLSSGNKNFGIASNISSDNGQWYWAGFNGNNRMQAGFYNSVDSASVNANTNLKGYQNSSDGTTFSSSSDLVYYKFRYEYDNGTINFYCNDLFMGKNSVLANYTPGKGYSGTVGVYTCAVPFEISSVRIGLPTENQTKLILETSDATLSRLWSKYVRLIDNASTDGIRVNDEKSFKVTTTTASGGADTWTATSTNPSVLSVSPASGASGDTLTVKGTGVGTASVIISNASDTGSKRAITYAVAKKLPYVDDPYTGIDAKVYPNIGATSAYTDGELAITFDSAPTIADTTGKIYIYKYSDDTLVDTIAFSNATETAFNSERSVTSLDIGTQMYRIAGNTLYLTPHFGKLEYGTRYYIAIPNEEITGTLGGINFTGFSPAKRTWNFTTKAAPSISGSLITVDGSQSSMANFRTVQKALNYLSTSSLTSAEVQIAPGTYREILTFSKNLNLTLKGMGSGTYGNDVIIQYTAGAKMNSSTTGRPVVLINSTGTTNLINLTLKNPGAKSVVNQAETLCSYNDSGKLVAKNCSFISQQDTLYTRGYNWFKDCYIEGNTDFIWGYSNGTLFENCNLKVLDNSGNYSVIFQARSPEGSKGYVLLNCTIQNENTLNGSYFARSSGMSTEGTRTIRDNVSIINCKLTGSGLVNNWYTNPTPTPATATALAGWKQYGLTDGSGNPVTVTCANAYTMTEAEYNANWASRALIFGSEWSPVEP